MTRQLERFLNIDQFLRSPERHTAASIAEALEVSERTIQSDFAFMRDRFQAPIQFSKTKGQHYTDPNWRLPSISLTEGELFALTLGARMLAAYAGSAYEVKLESAVDQLVARLPETVQTDLQQLAQHWVVFHPGATNVNFDSEVWQKLEFACQMFRSVRITYFSPKRNEASERIVDPYVLRISRTNPYLTGFCHSRQAIRDFRVDRIQAIEVLTDLFEIDPTFDPQAYLEAPFFHEQGGEPQWVSIWFDAETAPYIRERQWHSSQVIEEREDGSLILGVEVRGLEEVKRWVMYYGQGAIALEPIELAGMIRAELRAMTKNYKKGI
ncbi:MAG: WYL domain-containing transcriptional regulator [Cyanothece sp. SIO2G6]|nr:WYL domain-containing transcriptional regulator [Cyanothece sp. SIO2G6]